MLAILLNKRQYACGNDAMGAAEVRVDLCVLISMVYRSRIVVSAVPCSVRVIDCSSFSSSSVKVSCLDIEDPGRDIICRLLGLADCGVDVAVGGTKVACRRLRRV